MIGKEERDAVMRVMDRGILSGYQGNWSDAFYGGPEVKALEKEWSKYFGVKHAIATNSATSGLWMACAAAGLGQGKENCEVCYYCHCAKYNNRTCKNFFNRGSEVIVTPYSMTCSASIPLHFGAKPVFADIESDYFCLDPKDVEAKITPRTKAIIVVDLFGQPYNADDINTIAKKHGIMVIEDAAQAAGATYKGRYAGTLGDIGVYSLNVHKPIQCGEGGIVVTDNDELATKLRLLMNHAEAVVNDMMLQGQRVGGLDLNAIQFASTVGMNLRMTELSAAVAREQLKKLESILATAGDLLPERLGVKVRPDCEHAFYRYVVSEQRYTDIVNTLRPHVKYLEVPVIIKGIGMTAVVMKKGYITPIYKMPLFRHLGYPDGLCPVCESIEENIVLAWMKETS